MKSICVCGAGTMGGGIAQTAAQRGLDCILFDVDEAALLKSKSVIEKNLRLLADKKKITKKEKESAFQRIRFTSRPADCIAEVILEAVVEKASVKTALFNQLAAFNTAATVFATNTSSLSVTDIASGCPFPERVVGMHFFNPAPLMKLVEIVHTRYTSETSASVILSLAARLGKEAVICADAPGFIVNHVARPFYLEALRLAEQGVAGISTIDRLVESAGFKMGPFRLMDLIGNDINYAVSCSLYEAMGKPPRLKPSVLQEQKVQQGELGKKTGKGYYNYTE
jgi:3-hydroxybutyryl-CoA dehydrogenase